MGSEKDKVVGAKESLREGVSLRDRQPRACDNCFKAREKCSATQPNGECDRCRRLCRPCLYNRPLRQPGRPRLRSSLRRVGLESPARLQLQYISSPFGPLFKSLRSNERLMFEKFVDPSNFIDIMPAPRVGVDMHREAVYCLYQHFDDINDGYFAMYEVFDSVVTAKLPSFDLEGNIRRGALALKKFRELPCPSDYAAFAPWLWLGNTIIIHADFAFGINALPLRRYILTHLNRLGEPGRPLLSHPVIVSMTILDILNSVIRCEVPVIGLPVCDLAGIDPFFNICAPLLQILLQLCSVAFSGSVVSENSKTSRLKELETVVQAWQPELSPEILDGLSKAQTIQALSQARAHRMMVLLFIHRLRFPFGMQDSPAEVMAKSIISDLHLTTKTNKKSPRWVGLPFLIATFEATGTQERELAVAHVQTYVHWASPLSKAATQNFLRELWKTKDCTPGLGWVEMMRRLPDVFISG